MADIFTWSSEYSVGLPDIDEQHKRFFSIINEIIEYVNSHKPLYALNTSLKNLADYSEYHFKLEEKYFNEFKYPEAEVHIRDHNLFRSTISNFYTERNETTDIYITAFKLSDFAEKWLKEHILTTDHKYVEFFKAHGVGALLSQDIN